MSQGLRLSSTGITRCSPSIRNNGDNATLHVTESTAGVTFNVHIQPRASRNELCGLHGDELKVRLTSPPVEGAANKLCAEFFAKLFGVAKSKVVIIAGEKSRHKTIRVTGIDKEAVLALLR